MKRSKHSLSHYKLLSCNMGNLIPAGVVEVLPGDSIQMATSALVRCSPLVTPVMHPVDVRFHHFFVPLRLIWENFQSFITGGKDGMDASVYPTRTFTGVAVGTLPDYMGVPLSDTSITVSALPFRAYNLIWNECFRDQDLQTELVISTADGNDTTTNMLLQRCGWEKDYFTSSRPWEQKGPSISIPLGTEAPVKGIGVANTGVTGGSYSIRETGGIRTVSPTYNAGTNGVIMEATGAVGGVGNPKIVADLTGVSAITVTALREALSLQRFEEARARYGSRYVEYLRYLGVSSSDARLQRPEYLGGGKQTIQFSEVLQTAEGESPVGEMRGHGIGAMRSNRFRRFFEEHGYIITLMSARPKTMYFQGIPRHFNRRTKEDFWQMELQHIGQQEVLNKEIYAKHTTPDGVFGYQDRYDEYRRIESSVAGEFRTTSLYDWHMAREFASDPALNASFIECVPTERTFADTNLDVLRVMAKHSIQARRLVTNRTGSHIF